MGRCTAMQASHVSTDTPRVVATRPLEPQMMRPELRYVSCFLVFFFQAEDGIRDVATGVQTCALPISEALESELEQIQQELSDLGGWRDRVILQETAVAELVAQLEALQTEIAPGGSPLDRLGGGGGLPPGALSLAR